MFKVNYEFSDWIVTKRNVWSKSKHNVKCTAHQRRLIGRTQRMLRRRYNA